MDINFNEIDSFKSVFNLEDEQSPELEDNSPAVARMKIQNSIGTEDFFVLYDLYFDDIQDDDEEYLRFLSFIQRTYIQKYDIDVDIVCDTDQDNIIDLFKFIEYDLVKMISTWMNEDVANYTKRVSANDILSRTDSYVLKEILISLPLDILQKIIKGKAQLAKSIIL